MNNWITWAKGLAAAVIGGAATTVTNIVVAPDTFNLTASGLKKMAASAAASAIFSAALYLKQSPLPSGDAPK